MWPFRKKAATGSVPYVGAEQWAAIGGVVGVSPAAAQSLSAVSACVSLISETIASLPAAVVLSDNSQAEQPDHALSRLIAEGPNENSTWSDLVGDWIASTLLTGNGVLEPSFTARGEVSRLALVPWQTVTPFVSSDGSLELDVISTLPPHAGERRRLLRGDFVYLKDRSDNGITGVSRLSRSASALQLALNTQNAAVTFGTNASRPAGTLNAPGKISKETAERLALEWDSAFSGARAGKTAVLPEGLSWNALSLLSAEDQQLVERLRYSVEDVSRIFGVPLYLLGDPNRATFASAREATSNFVRSLLPWIAKVERAFAQSILDDRYRLRLDPTALLQSDPASLADGLAKLRQAGVISPNDARAFINLPAVDDGDDIAPPNTSAAAVSEPTAPAAEDAKEPVEPADAKKLIDLARVAMWKRRREIRGRA